MLDPDAVAGHTFGTSFRGYDTEEVRRFLVEVAHDLRALAAGALEDIGDERATMLLGEEAGRLLGAARAAAAEVEANAGERAAEVLREAQEEAIRLRSTIESERDRAYAEGAARAEEVLAEAQRSKEAIEAAARKEADDLVAEAVAAREHVLGDLARRRKAVRAQVEQLHAARQKLLDALGDVGRIVEEARGRLVVALPEAKLAADAAARRAADEPEATIEALESELEAFRLAGLALGAGVDETDAVEEAADDSDASAEVADTAEANGDAGQQREGRRSSSVRVFRTRREAAPALGLPESELHEVAPADPLEEVRVVPVERNGAEAVAEPEVPEAEVAEAEPAEAESEPEQEPEPAPEPEAAEAQREPEEAEPEPEAAEPEAAASDSGLDAGAVDALFARLRAGREVRTAAAEAVLAPETEPEPEAEPERAADVPVHVGGGDDRTALLARRDDLLAPPVAALIRRSKRLLADEQNAVLEALRRSGATADAVTARADLERRWAEAAGPDLDAAAGAGMAYLGGTGFEAPTLDDIAADLAAAIAGPLYERLLVAVERADGDDDLAADAVRSVCREWRTRRLSDGVEHAVRAAFGRGALAAAEVDGRRVCWVVDDGGAPCPDAEDNALAGSMPAGEPFPTGHRHPPAHPGCRCVLAVAR